MFEQKSDLENRINIANQKISSSQAELFNDLESIKEIVPEPEKNLIDEQIDIIDTALNMIFKIYHQYLRAYLSKHTTLFKNKSENKKER